MRTFTLFLLFILLQSVKTVNAQGCSDVGFCTIGIIKPTFSKAQAQKKQQIGILLGNGIGDQHVYVFTPGIQYNNQLSKQWAVQGKLTGNYASGKLGSSAGEGDLFLSGTLTPLTKGSWNKSFLLGTKIFLNEGDSRKGNMPLPMQYQSSLGTIDLLAGITIYNSNWSFSAALQQPISGRNRNTFLPQYLNTLEAYKYPSTNDFNRKGDVLLKTSHQFKATPKIKFTLGLLGIYHLGRDTYINGNLSNKPLEIKGSEGLTLNLTETFIYQMNPRISVGLSGGVPFVTRKVRPDGLTRVFILTPEINFNF